MASSSILLATQILFHVCMQLALPSAHLTYVRLSAILICLSVCDQAKSAPIQALQVPEKGLTWSVIDPYHGTCTASSCVCLFVHIQLPSQGPSSRCKHNMYTAMHPASKSVPATSWRKLGVFARQRRTSSNYFSPDCRTAARARILNCLALSRTQSHTLAIKMDAELSRSQHSSAVPPRTPCRQTAGA